MEYTFTVDTAHEGLRIDVFLTHVMSDIPSRSFVKKLLDGGHVLVNGKTAKPKYKIQNTDKVDVVFDENLLPKSDIPAEDLDLDIFFEDDQIVVINKPVGMTVHRMRD